MKAKIEFIHSWYLFIFSFLGLFFLLLSNYLWASLVIVVVLHYFFFKNGLKKKAFIRNIFYAALFASLMGVMNLLWTSAPVKTSELIELGGWTVEFEHLINALRLFSKLFLLIMTSMGSVRVINYTKVVLYLVVNKGLKVLWGYPIIIALNSILLFKEEYDRIRLNGQLRNLGWQGKLKILFPLLVFAIRHSQRGSLSLVTRGLNPHKNFYFNYQIYPHDRVHLKNFLVLYTLLVFSCLALRFYFR